MEKSMNGWIEPGKETFVMLKKPQMYSTAS